MWTVENDGEAMVISLSGRLDGSNSKEIEQYVNTMPDIPEKSLVIVDLSQLNYISSAGLRTLLLLGKKTNAKQATLIFAGLNGLVKEIFQISGFLTMFMLADSVAHAKTLH